MQQSEWGEQPPAIDQPDYKRLYEEGLAAWKANSANQGQVIDELRATVKELQWDGRYNVLEAERDGLRAEIDRAYQTLAVYGVPKERARTVTNGIDVLVTRIDKELVTLRRQLAQYHSPGIVQVHLKPGE